MAFSSLTGSNPVTIHHDKQIMARLPSLEELLLEFHQSLGLKTYLNQKESKPESYPSRWKNDFSDLGMPLEKYSEEFPKMLMAIFQALDMDEDPCQDALSNVMEWAGFHKALELRTWTGNASQQQVLWHLLAYSYVPALARRLAFWTLHNIQNDLPPLDAGMPGGKFWFLPNWDKEADRIELPVAQVMAWLFDLLGGQSLETALGALQRDINGKTVNGDVLRTLQGWYLEGRIPKSAKMIGQIFSNDASLKFNGAFLLDDSLSREDQFQAALAFVRRKGLTAKVLKGEIPLPLERLEPMLIGSASDEDKQEFIECICQRYAEPEMRTIRQRLLVARMAQDGYTRLLKSLCPDVQATCTDPARNKLLQLTSFFKDIYNRTITASNNGDSVEEQDAWFENHLNPWDKADLLLSILPSLHGEAKCSLLAERLTRQFMTLAPNSPLEDLVPLSKEESGPLIERRLRQIEQQCDEDNRLTQLAEKVRAGSPWRALEAEDSYWVVSQFANRENLPTALRNVTLHRMRALAVTPGQKVAADVIELGQLLNCEPKHRPKDVQQRVQSLLDDALSCLGYEEWKAPLLRFWAKHHLFQNDFESATTDFKAALDACSERGFGGLRGEIAWDGFATEIAEKGFIPENQERYYRNILGYMEFPEGFPSFEDAATECEEFFWTTLYQPYPGIQHQEGLAIVQFKAACVETFALIENADWDRLRDWMQRHAKKFRKTNLKDARRNSVLLHWLKMLSGFESRMPPPKAMASREMAADLGKIGQHMKNWRIAIRLLLEAWPEQAKIADFKGQTPLMLAADNCDVELTRLLAPMSDVDAQDHQGRTALHAAVAGRSPGCVAIVLERNPHVAKVAAGKENTALHTAVCFGVPENVRLILEEFPFLALKGNTTKQTPLVMARDIHESWPAWREFMEKMNRSTGSKKDFEEIIALLESGIASIQ